MLHYDNVEVGVNIFILEDGANVLEMEVLGKSIKDGSNRLKIKGSDLTFEVDFDDVSEDTYIDGEEAKAISIKYIFDSVNEKIRDISNNALADYYDVEVELEKYKILFPEMFI